MPRYQDSGKLRGYGIVSFGTQESAEKALELNNSLLKGRYLEVSRPTNKQTKSQVEVRKLKKQITEDMRTIFVKNLPYNCNQEEIGDFFGSCGKVKNVRMVYNSVTNHFKGFAYIEFEKSFAISPALSLNGRNFGGRPLVIDIDHGAPKSGYKQPSVDGQLKYNETLCK